MFMANSNAFLGIDNISDIKLGLQGGKLYLGETLLYPLEKPIGDAVVSCDDATYNGSLQTAQNIVVTLSGVTLVAGTDYTVTSNTGGTNVGTYVVEVTGAGDYTGTTSGIFTINKVTPTVTAPTAKVLTYNTQAQELVNAGSTDFGTLKYSLDNTNYSTAIPSGTNATSYTVYYRVDGDSNVNSVAAQSIGVTIAKAGTTYVAPTANNRAYDTTSKALLNAGSVTGGTIQYSSDNSTWSGTIPSGTNAGTYTSYWRIVGDSNHNDKASASISTTISPKTVSSPTITLSQSTYTYANTAYTPTPTVKDGTVTIASSEYTVSYSNNTNVGTATCTITDKTGGNYTVSGSKTFTINCYSATAPTAKNGNWTDSAQDLVNAGSTSYGTMVYSTTSGGTYTTTIPTGVNAESYEVWWKVTGNTNVCNTAATKVACAINKVAMSYTSPKATAYVYNSSARALMSGGGGQGSIEWSNGNTQTSVGSKTTKARWSGNSNYNASPYSNEVTLAMNKAAGSVSTAPVNNNYTYNGTARAVASAGSGTGTMYYRLGTSGSFSTTMPTMTDAGSNTLYYYAAASTNYEQSSTGSITVSVQKANGSVTTAPTAKSLTYSGSNQALINAGSGTGTMMYNLNGGSWGTSIPSASTAGSYTVYYKASASTNYNESTSGSVDCSIAKANISPTVSISNWTYGGTASNPSVAGNSGSGTVTYYYKLSSSSSWSTTKPSNAGSYNIRADIAATTNYNSGTCTSNFTINKANSSLSFSVTDITVEKGQTKTNAVTVNAGDGTVTYSSNNTTAITVNNSGTITGVGVGNATITANISEGTNYKTSSASYTASCTVVAVVLTAKFNVTDTSNPTQIIGEYAEDPFSAIEIDGAVQPSVVSSYTFSTTGEHTVKYTLTDPTSIGNETFVSCHSLTSVDIPSGVTSIGNGAFDYCTGLTSVTIPSSVTSIGNSAFYDCYSLTSIDIPDSVTSIGYGAFTYCTGLTSVTIPSSVTSISEYAFSSCYGLTSINIPDSVTSIGNSAFYDCSGLTSCTIGSGVTSIGDRTFYQCSGLTSCTIGSGSIGNSAFTNCYSLSSCTLGSGVTSIGSNAFYSATSLTSIDIPDSVTSIGNSAFTYCTSLTSCTIGSGVTSIGDRTFYQCSGLTSIDIPDSVTSIGNLAFMYCSSLTSCTIGSGVTSIVDRTFSRCSGLTSIDIPDSVTSIGTSAFTYCTSLTSCTIGSGVTSIGNMAFYTCRSLTSITSNAMTAPTIVSSTFRGVKTNGILTVPSGSSGYDVWMGTGNYYLGKNNWTKVEQ